ncbi:unnamed protein product [Symbiodinium sp. CCMP2592]|nr:unnamed protein product [Symbiodinium sp. CCMP2592]
MGAQTAKPGDYAEPDLPHGVHEVRLSVYTFDITGVSLLNSLGSLGTGAYHSGLVVLDNEWSYGGHSEPGSSGAYNCEPEHNPEYQFFDRVVMGRVRASPQQIQSVIRRLATDSEWQGPMYDLFQHNCNHFVSDLCWALLRRRPPDWINQTAERFGRTRRIEYTLKQALRLAMASYKGRYAGPVNGMASVICGSDLKLAASGSSTKIYRWIEFANKGEQITEFDESHFQLQGHFESNSSEGHKTYQDRLRSIHFRKEGKTKAEIARLLGRSEQFVAKWWQKDEREIPRPWGVHEYMSKELGTKTATSQATLSENSEVSTAAWWRDVEVRRKYHVDPDVYDELLNNTEWKSSAARTRDFSTGASHVKYDKEGKMKLQGNQSAKYTKGSSPAFDRMLQKFFSEYGLAERTSGIGLNWYPDGDSVLGSHRHDCWTALFSFGDERILTIDKTPLLLQDCDLVIFGTQRHGVPKMPEIKGGRITVPIFFYPTHMQMKKQWQTLTDPEDPRRSNELAKLQCTHQLGSDVMGQTLWSDPQRSLALEQLLQLGFDLEASRNALQAPGGSSGDSRPSAGSRAEPMWAVANISVASAGQLHKARGDVVVPYQGPNIQDDFIHRIFFRVYEQPSRIPPQNLGNFGQLQSWMSRNGLVGQTARTGGKMSELLLTAVRKRPMPVASASMPGFMATLPDRGDPAQDCVRRCKAQRRRWQEFVFGI